MGTAGESRQGLWIQTRHVSYTPPGVAPNPTPPKLEKYSEVTMIVDWGQTLDPTQALHDHGLKIGMGFHRGHTPSVAWAAAAPGHASPQTLAYAALPEIRRITQLLDNVFTTDGRWHGYLIPQGAVSLPGPKSIYFRTTLDPFHAKNDKDLHFVPVVVVLDSFPDFTQHYAVGVGTFTKGKGGKALELDSQILTNV